MTTLTGPRTPGSAAPARVAAAPRPQASIAQGLDPLLVLRKYKLLFVMSLLVGAILGTGAHFALKMLYPTYVANAIFKCNPPPQPIGEAATRVDDDELQLFMANQMSLILSDQVLSEASNNPKFLNDARGWWRRYGARYNNNVFDASSSAAIDKLSAIEDLQDQLKVRVKSGTTYLEMQMGWRTATDSTAIVKYVKDAYLDVVRRAALAELDQQQRTLSDLQNTLEGQIESLAGERANKIAAIGADNVQARHSETNSALQGVNTSLLATQNERTGVETQFQALSQAMSAGVVTEDIRAAIEQDRTILSLKTEINALQAERNALLEQVTPDHRDVKQIDSRISGIQRKLDEERQTLQRQAMESQLDSLRRSITTYNTTERDLLAKRTELADRLSQLTKLEGEIGEIDRRAANAVSRLDETESRIEEIDNQRKANLMRVEVAQAERKPTDVAFPKIYLMIPAGMVVLLGLTVGVAFLRELVDQRVKGPADLASLPRGRILGMMPHADESPDHIEVVETVFRELPRSVMSESFRQLRAVLQQRATSMGPCSILFAGCMPGSGSTTIAANLALAFAAADAKVLLIDANSRRPRLHSVFGVPAKPGLGDCLAGSAALSDCAQRIPGVGTLDVLCTGSNEAQQLERITTDRMSELLSAAKQKYDVVLIDTAPAIVSGDARALAGRCDYSVMIARTYAEKRGMVARVFGELSEQRAELLGVIVNAMRSTTGGYLKTNIRATHQYHNTDK